MTGGGDLRCPAAMTEGQWGAVGVSVAPAGLFVRELNPGPERVGQAALLIPFCCADAVCVGLLCTNRPGALWGCPLFL